MLNNHLMQVREILKVSLGIARDVPILRVKRAHTGESYIHLTMIVLVLYLLLSYTALLLMTILLTREQCEGSQASDRLLWEV